MLKNLIPLWRSLPAQVALFSLLASSVFALDLLELDYQSPEIRHSFKCKFSDLSQLGFCYLSALAAHNDGYHSDCEYFLARAHDLIKAGASSDEPIRISSNAWWRPIHFAVTIGHLDEIKALKKLGCDLDACDSHGRSPLAAALILAKENLLIGNISAYRKNSALAKALIHLDAHVERCHENRRLLYLAIFSPEITEELTRRTLLSYRKREKISVIGDCYQIAYNLSGSNLFASRELLKSARHLIQAGFGVHMPVQEGKNGFLYPLHYAVMLNLPEHVTLLLKRGVNVQKLDYLKCSPLSIAVAQIQSGHFSPIEKHHALLIAHILIQHGANTQEIDPHKGVPFATLIAEEIPELLFSVRSAERKLHCKLP